MADDLDDLDDEPSRTQISHRALIERLRVGDSYSIAQRLDQDLCRRDDIARETERLRGRLAQPVSQVKTRTGRQFEVTNGEFRTHKTFDPVLVVVVTRIT